MIIKDGNIESESERENDNNMPLLEDYSNIVYTKGENLIVQCTLSLQNKQDEYGE